MTAQAKLVLHTFPTVSEQLVVPFTFYFGHQFYAGVRHAGELYKLVAEVCPQQRLIAYQTAAQLVEQGNTVLLTVSSAGYRTWVSLRSPDCFRAAR